MKFTTLSGFLCLVFHPCPIVVILSWLTIEVEVEATVFVINERVLSVVEAMKNFRVKVAV